MKPIRIVIVTGILLLFINTLIYAQRVVRVPGTIIIEPYQLQITFYKTTNLIFPYAIKSVDRGSRDILAQKAKGVENVLLVKAARENFPETNLSVITADGKLYSFLLNYSSNPSLLNISFAKDTVVENTSMAMQPEGNVAQREATAARVSKANQLLHGVKDKAYAVQFRLRGLYLENNVLYFQLEVRNRSNLPYDMERLRFFIRDEKKVKRTASRELEINPLYVYGDTASLKGQSQTILVFALPQFTLPDKKYLLIQLMESKGSRNLYLHVHPKTIVKARTIEP